MSYRIEYSPRAIMQLDRIPQADRARIVKKIAKLADNPHPPGSLSLKGYPHLSRIRIGDYRAIYTINKMVITVSIAAVGHRKDIYRRLNDLLK